jgi:hypothetical protein
MVRPSECPQWEKVAISGPRNVRGTNFTQVREEGIGFKWRSDHNEPESLGYGDGLGVEIRSGTEHGILFKLGQFSSLLFRQIRFGQK